MYEYMPSRQRLDKWIGRREEPPAKLVCGSVSPARCSPVKLGKKGGGPHNTPISYFMLPDVTDRSVPVPLPLTASYPGRLSFAPSMVSAKLGVGRLAKR